MLHTTNPVIKHKAGLLNLAEELSNVSKACKIMGVSRDTFYRYRELADEGGVDDREQQCVHGSGSPGSRWMVGTLLAPRYAFK